MILPPASVMTTTTLLPVTVWPADGRVIARTAVDAGRVPVGPAAATVDDAGRMNCRGSVRPANITTTARPISEYAAASGIRGKPFPLILLQPVHPIQSAPTTITKETCSSGVPPWAS